MPNFRYQAFDKDTGQEKTGEIEAETEEEALKAVQAKDLSVFELEMKGEAKSSQDSRGSFSLFNSEKDNLILFTNQLANLLQAGVQLGEALEVAGRLLEAGDFKTAVQEIHSSLKGGKDFAEALADYPQYFSSDYISMVKAGEEGGFLGLACQRLADNLEQRSELKSFITSSLIYPFVLALVALAAIVVMLTYVLPNFSLIYDNYGEEVPAATQVLLDISQFLSSYWLIILLVGGGVLLGLAIFYQTEQGKRQVDNLLLELPFTGSLITNLTVIKLSRNMGSMVDSGVPLLRALQVSQHVTTNYLLQQALKQVTTQVQKGNQLSEALEQIEVFPEIVTYMVEVGERTGSLGPMLLQIAENFETKTRKTLDKTMKIFEPAVILIMGVIIGFIVISMLLPILSISDISF
jgi:type II secretory pathway component PulF